jgi:glutamine---fructose-6-phosphate transaminase (isomerizing)
VERVTILACGTSWHAGLVGKYLIEELAQLPVEVDYGSEYRYRNPIVGPRRWPIVITQSGETADTLAALREARKKGARSVAICNVVGSMATREADGTVYTHAGPEIGVASTKAFTSQLVALHLLAAVPGAGARHAARPTRSGQAHRGAADAAAAARAGAAASADRGGRRALLHANGLPVPRRGINYPIALEGALKLKEISYIHAEGYPAGEMKHGPIALIDEQMPVVAIAPHDARLREDARQRAGGQGARRLGHRLTTRATTSWPAVLDAARRRA